MKKLLLIEVSSQNYYSFPACRILSCCFETLFCSKKKHTEINVIITRIIGEENMRIPKKQIARISEPILKNMESNNLMHANTPSKALHRKNAFAIATSVCILKKSLK